MNKVLRSWSQKRDKKLEKLTKVQKWLEGKYVDSSRIVDLMEMLIEPGAKVVLEGDNQKQASFLSQKLLNVFILYIVLRLFGDLIDQLPFSVALLLVYLSIVACSFCVVYAFAQLNAWIKRVFIKKEMIG